MSALGATGAHREGRTGVGATSQIAKAGAVPSTDAALRLIAFYLPQFHPVPENDRWWGDGFTEWTNVVRASSLFPGHHQPRVPADLGLYDLRVPEVRAGQADLARAHGINAFCYYHYWFEGRRLLNRPFDDVLASGEPDLDFCLCWANESWTRRWDGGSQDILMAQTYSPQDDLEHIRWLLPALADPRAVRIGDRPMFVVYRPGDLPDAARTIDTWRGEVDRAGLPGIHLVAVECSAGVGRDAMTNGFDATVRFQPDWGVLNDLPRAEVGPTTLRVYDYDECWPLLADAAPVDYCRYETVFPGWDNTPRVGVNGIAFRGSRPESYERWLREAATRAMAQAREQRVVFVNAWNEWAEGCHVEPDLQYGLAYLTATKQGAGEAQLASTVEPARRHARGDHALVASYNVPDPDRDSGSRRMVHLIELLQARGYDVTFVAVNGVRQQAPADRLRQQGVAVYDGLRCPFEELLARTPFDIAIMAFWQVAERWLPMIRARSPRTRVVIDSVDLQFVRDARRALRSRPDVLPETMLTADFADELRGELNTYSLADAVMTVSPGEASLVNSLIGHPDLAHCVPDLEDGAAPEVPFSERAGILFVGSYRHPPNVEAVHYLCTEVVPRLDPDLLEAHPVMIVGDGLDDSVRAYADGLRNVRMIGWVPTLEPYFGGARISVVPLRYGAGTKRKLVQALWSGLPAVSTSVGAEGLDVRDGEHLLVADDPESFARAVTRLLTDELLWRRLTEKGRAQIARTHDRVAVARRLGAILQGVRSRPPRLGTGTDPDPETYRRRLRYQGHQKLLDPIQEIVRQTVAPGNSVLVVAEGGEGLLVAAIDGAAAFPVPNAGLDDGDGDALVAHLEQQRADGGAYLLVSSLAEEWLDHRPELREHLTRLYPVAARREGVCTLFALTASERP